MKTHTHHKEATLLLKSVERCIVLAPHSRALILVYLSGVLICRVKLLQEMSAPPLGQASMHQVLMLPASEHRFDTLVFTTTT